MITLNDYRSFIDVREIRKIEEAANDLRGREIVHINATKYGGGVAEMLRSLIPLLRSLGLRARWDVLEGDERFFEITKRIHNSLQGNKELEFTAEMWSHYLEVNRRNSMRFEEGDFTFVHDPQPLPLVEGRGNGVWIWRCHIDPSRGNPSVLKFLSRFIERYDALIFSLEDYIIPLGRAYVIHPTIDPLSEKNRDMTPSEVEGVLGKHGIDPDRPIIGQVSRYDPWKDPLGVIRVYRRVKERVRDVQLVMVGSSASDDPESSKWYELTRKEAEGLRDVHLLTDLPDIEVNAIQRSYQVALQLSTREGFGLTVTEAMWKGVPVVARPSGGIKLQVIEGVTGLLVSDLDNAVSKVIYLMKRPWLSRILGHNGREHVRRNFLITRLLKDHLRIMRELHLERAGQARAD